LAGEIHDSLAQNFTGITMQLEMAREVMTERDDGIVSYIERADDLARFGLAEARRSVLSLQRVSIKDSSLLESLQVLAERSNIPGRLCCTFRSNVADEEGLPVVVRQDLLRIAQEAISNALRYARSTAIDVSLRSDSHNLILEVKRSSVSSWTGVRSHVSKNAGPPLQRSGPSGQATRKSSYNRILERFLLVE
jgi:signal transduction histidine kinase